MHERSYHDVRRSQAQITQRAPLAVNAQLAINLRQQRRHLRRPSLAGECECWCRPFADELDGCIPVTQAARPLSVRRPPPRRRAPLRSGRRVGPAVRALCHCLCLCLGQGPLSLLKFRTASCLYPAGRLGRCAIFLPGGDVRQKPTPSHRTASYKRHWNAFLALERAGSGSVWHGQGVELFDFGNEPSKNLSGPRTYLEYTLQSRISLCC